MALHELVTELADFTRRNDASLLHDGEAIGGAAREHDVLLDEDHGEAHLAVETQNHLLDLLNDGRLNAFGRLIEEEYLGIGRKRPRDRELLLLPAGQHAAGPIEILDQIGKQLGDEIRNNALAIRPREGAEQDVLTNGKIRNDLAALRHVGAAGARPAERRLLAYHLVVATDFAVAAIYKAQHGLEQPG